MYAQIDANNVLILNSGTTAEINAISPPLGALVYNTDDHKIYQFNGAIWAVTSNTNSWTVVGNHQYSSVSGNVGIGTITPSEKLDVNGTLQFGDVGATNGVIHMLGKYSGINHINTYGSERSSGATVIGYGVQPKVGAAGYVSSAQNVAFRRGLIKNDGNFQFLTAASAQVNVGTDVALIPRFTILNNGNVGIGTTNPSVKLEVAGQLKITGGTPAAGKILTSNATGLATWQNPANTNDNDWIISGNNQYSAVSGNVGIGTTTPNAQLEISPTNISSIQEGIRLIDEGGGSSEGLWLQFGQRVINDYARVGGRSNNNTSGSLYFSTKDNADAAPLERMRINPKGYVGIGTASPAYRLDVRENSTAAGIGTQETISISNTVAANATNSYGIYSNSAPTATGTVTNNYSIFADSQIPSGGTTTNTYGLYGRSLISGTTTHAYGVYGSADVLNGGNATGSIRAGQFYARIRSGSSTASSYGLLSYSQHEGTVTGSNIGIYSISRPLSGATVGSNYSALNHASIPVGGTVTSNNMGTQSLTEVFGTVSGHNFGVYSLSRLRGGSIGLNNFGVYSHTGHINSTLNGSNYGIYSYSPGDANSSVGTNFAGYFNADHRGNVNSHNYGIYSIARTANGGTIGGSNYAGYFHAASANSNGSGFGTIAGDNFGIRIIMGSNGVSGSTYGIYQSGDAGTKNYFQNAVGINTTGGAGILNVNGVATKTGGGVWAVFSDRRSKENIKNYTKGLNELLQLRPVSFNYKKSFNFGTETHVGFIAQEVEKVIPTMVTESNTHGIKDFKQVDANEVTYMLINAVKELKAENKTLKTENTLMLKRLESLEKALKELQKQ